MRHSTASPNTCERLAAARGRPVRIKEVSILRYVFIPSYRAVDAPPIYYGPHGAHNEPTAKVVRGHASRSVRSEAGAWQLPIAEAEFNSLYQVQEGSHVNDGTESSSH